MASAMPAAMPIAMPNIKKHFGGVAALAGVSFDVRAGEIHALCGENGAGKSTLVKILSGAITDYEGELFLHGEPVRLAGPRDAEDRGQRHLPGTESAPDLRRRRTFSGERPLGWGFSPIGRWSKRPQVLASWERRSIAPARCGSAIGNLSR